MRTKPNMLRSAAISLCGLATCLLAIVLLQNNPAPLGPKLKPVDTVTFGQHVNTKVTIKSGSLTSSSPISNDDFGVNDVWYDNGYGTANPLTEQPYQQLVGDTRSIGVSIIRYPGGNPSDTFHWEDAIGPQSTRQPMVVDSGAVHNANAVLPATFGPAEYGTLLSETNAAGDITVNFGTGTAAEAAAWVCYETAPYPDPMDPSCNQYAMMRVVAGHPAPFNIPYWEVGNEPYVQAYWRSGQVVSSPGKCKTGQRQCLYVYGGTTQFTNQIITPIHSQNRKSNTVGPPQYYIPNPPVIPVSLQLSINGSAWQQVTVQALSRSKTAAHVYAVNTTTGQLQFPTHAILSSQKVTVSYQSGPHDGFNAFYVAMKKVNPTIHVCETYPSNTTLQMLGSHYPYNCYVLHDYGLIGGSDHNSYTAEQFHDQAVLDTQSFAKQLANVKTAVHHYAGSNAKNVQVIVSEYGIINYQHPYEADLQPKNSVFHGKTAYHSSDDLGLYVADMLRSLISSGVSMAAKHYLVGSNLSLIPGVQDGNNTYNFSSNAMISTLYPKCDRTDCPTPTFVMQSSAYVLGEFSTLLYRNLISSSVEDDPRVVVSRPNNYSRALAGSYPKLETLATTDGDGHEAILVINNSNDSISTQLRPTTPITSVNAWTVGGNYLAYNTLTQPDDVQLRHTFTFWTANQTATFPPSSVTVLRF
jgi:alpha-N-arabinofuranosidase